MDDSHADLHAIPETGTGLAHPVQGGLPALSFAALGVVFGDIGTSPLYTLKTVLAFTGAKPAPEAVLGSLSLIVWTLLIITSVKYVSIAMRVDNNGEGGILALMALLGLKRANRPVIVALGLAGAALIYGDGAITPAISVLSALEGLEMVTPAVKPFILPAAVVILVGLFALQSQGTARIGRFFGPVMVIWFAVIAILGLRGLIHHPQVLYALDPRYGLRFLISGGWAGVAILGAVFLCVTGAEALYADMGHFGAKPIRLAWTAVVLPALVLNYAGQAALVLEGTPAEGNIFYQLCPGFLLMPMVGLATVATIIASQAIITGAFSMTRQAMQLGWLPRLRVKQTSEEGYGQIYVGAVNWLLMLITLGLTVGFGKSDNIASAYGIAVAITMLTTTVLLFFAMRDIWGWSIPAALALAIPLLVVDMAFVAANAVKIAEGGYVPILLAVLIFGLMNVWHHGREAVTARLRESVVPVETLLAMLRDKTIARVPGTAVFLTRVTRDAPPVLMWHLRHNRSLHEQVVVLTVVTRQVPYVNTQEQMEVTVLGPNLWRVAVAAGFMEKPDIQALLTVAGARLPPFALADVTYYVGRETIVRRVDGQGVSRWVAILYGFLQRNSVHVMDYFALPPDKVVEIGREVAI